MAREVHQVPLAHRDYRAVLGGEASRAQEPTEGTGVMMETKALMGLTVNRV